MPALERIGRATRAPPDVLRAASQCAAALLRGAMPGGEEIGPAQLAAAAARLAIAALRSGVPTSEVVSLLGA